MTEEEKLTWREIAERQAKGERTADLFLRLHMLAEVQMRQARSKEVGHDRR